MVMFALGHGQAVLTLQSQLGNPQTKLHQGVYTQSIDVFRGIVGDLKALELCEDGVWRDVGKCAPQVSGTDEHTQQHCSCCCC